MANKVEVKELLDAGVHFGHLTRRWNPKMEKFIFGSKNSIHIIDLVQTLEMINVALVGIHKCISSGGRVLFVSTKNIISSTPWRAPMETIIAPKALLFMYPGFSNGSCLFVYLCVTDFSDFYGKHTDASKLESWGGKSEL